MRSDLRPVSLPFVSLLDEIFHEVPPLFVQALEADLLSKLVEIGGERAIQVGQSSQLLVYAFLHKQLVDDAADAVQI